MVVLTSIFVAEIKSHKAAAEFLEDEQLFTKDKGAFEDMRELISMFEGKNRVEPLE